MTLLLATIGKWLLIFLDGFFLNTKKKAIENFALRDIMYLLTVRIT